MKLRINDSEAVQKFIKDTLSLRFETRTIQGYKIHFAQIGASDKPTLFFIHGSPGSWSAFENYLKDKELLKNFRMISIDRPGYGFSNFGNVLNYTLQTRLIGDLISQLQNEKYFYVVGHSLGGPIAVSLAAQHIQSISGIVLLAASVDPDEEKPEKWRKFFNIYPFRFLLPGAFRPSNTELCAFKKDVLLLPSDLNKVTCSVLLVHGLKDPLVPPGNSFYAQKQLTHALSVKLVTLKDANHFIPWKKYAEIKELLMNLPH